MVGYACLQWAGGSHVSRRRHRRTSARTSTSAPRRIVDAGTDGLAAGDAFARVVQVIDAASGLGGADDRHRLPAVALSGVLAPRDDRLAAGRASRLAAVGGAPARAGHRTRRAGPGSTSTCAAGRCGSAELMETHLAYPILALFRSQHINQNWLTALCTILDASALAVAAAPAGTVEAARFTFAISRHAVADLCYTFRVEPTPGGEDRLPPDAFDVLVSELAGEGRRARCRAGGDPQRSSTGCARCMSPTPRCSPTTSQLALPPWLKQPPPAVPTRTRPWPWSSRRALGPATSRLEGGRPANAAAHASTAWPVGDLS